MTTDEAAGVSLVALTAAQSIWFRLGLDAPFAYAKDTVEREHPEWPTPRARMEREVIKLLVYGTSTSVSLYAARKARISARASARKLQLLKIVNKTRWKLLKAVSYFYDHLVDYRANVYDAIPEGDTVPRSSTILAPDGRMAIMRSRDGGAWTAWSMSTEPMYRRDLGKNYNIKG